MNKQLALNFFATVRRSYSTLPSNTRIYNAPIHKEVMENWKPQTPDGPVYDGWALKVNNF